MSFGFIRTVDKVADDNSLVNNINSEQSLVS